jgi:hypothetical protein
VMERTLTRETLGTQLPLWKMWQAQPNRQLEALALTVQEMAAG